MKKETEQPHKCRIRYSTAPAGEGEDKLAWLARTRLSELRWEQIQPDSKGYWIDNPEEEFGDAPPIAHKSTKGTKVQAQERAIFKQFGLGVSTNRDEWVYDIDRESLKSKVRYLVKAYDAVPTKTKDYPDTIKWSRDLKRRLSRGRREKFSEAHIVKANYRPFIVRWLYNSPVFTDVPGLADEFFPSGQSNIAICFTDPTAQKPWLACAVDRITDLHYVGAGAGTVCMPRYWFRDGRRFDNITDWALSKFKERFGKASRLSKDDVFAYVYAALHDPLYRQTYALNLRREFPSVPFHGNFQLWCEWGETLLELHVGYNQAKSFPLVRRDESDPSRQSPRTILNADKAKGIIVLDSETWVSGIPTAAWDYKLGNRSALEWILDQHKEKTPSSRIVAEQFNTYRFADHKENLIELIAKLVTVSVRTVEIMEAMRTMDRAGSPNFDELEKAL